MLVSVIELTSIYCLVTFGLVLSFRMIGFADLTIESSFTTGAAVCAVLLSTHQANPFFAIVMATLAGIVAGSITGMLHVLGRISRLLSGIIMMTILYSVNLQIMKQSNMQLFSIPTLFSDLTADIEFFSFSFGILLLAVILVYFLHTRLGFLIRTCGENSNVVAKLGYNSGIFIVLTLALSNGLTAMSGAIAAQYFGYADIGMSSGLIVTAFASLVLGETLLPPTSIIRLVAAALIGTLVYRFAFEIGLRLNIHPWNLKIIVGLLLAISLIIRQYLQKKRSHLLVGTDAL